MARIGLGGADECDRGQLMLVAAVVLAVVLVALAFVLNAAVYTEALVAGDSGSPEDRTVARFQDDVRRGVGGLVVHHNRNATNNTTHADLHAALQESVERWDDLTARHAATSGSGTNVTLVGTDNGTRIAQDNATRAFTNATRTEGGNVTGNASDWTLVTDVNGTRRFRMNITSETSDLGEFGAADAFNVTVTNGSATWRMNVTNENGNATVGVRNASGGHAVCSAPANESGVWVNVTAGTVAGEECPGLAFAEGVNSPYEIRFESGDNVSGTYELVVDNETLATSPTADYVSRDDGSPYVMSAVYSATVRVEYRTPTLTYTTTVRVAPGEPT